MQRNKSDYSMFVLVKVKTSKCISFGMTWSDFGMDVFDLPLMDLYA